MIHDHIEMASFIQIDKDNYKTLFRCLFVIGEYTKCTPQSPHLSEDIKELLEELSPKNLLYFLKKIRNGLSHMSMVNIIDLENRTDREFKSMQLDLRKIEGAIFYALLRAKHFAVSRFASTVCLLNSTEEILEIFPKKMLIVFASQVEKYLIQVYSLGYQNVFGFFEEMKSNISNPQVQRAYCFEDFLKRHNIDWNKLSYEETKMYTNISREMKECLQLEEEFDAILETETFTLLYQYQVASFKIILGVFNRSLQLFAIPNFTSQGGISFIKILRQLCIQSHGFPQYNMHILQYIKDQVISIGRMTRSSQNAVLVVNFLRDNKFNFKITQGLSLPSISTKAQLTQKECFAVSQCQLNKIFTSIKESLKHSQGFDEHVKTEIQTYKNISELMNMLQGLRDGTILIEEKIKDHIKGLIPEKHSTVRPKLLQALENKEFDKCFELAKKQFKGRNKCRYEKLVRGFMKKENSNITNRISIIQTFLKEINFKTEPPDAVSQLVSKELLTRINEVFSKLQFIRTSLAKISADKTVKPVHKRLVKLSAELALLEIFELGHKLNSVEDSKAFFSMRPDLVLHCSKSMRNYLAHCDITFELLLINPAKLINVLIEELFFLGPDGFQGQHYFMQENRNSYETEFEDVYETRSCNINVLQDSLFDVISRDDVEVMKLYIESGADPKGTNIEKVNGFEFALHKSSLMCLQYLINTYKPIAIISNKENTSFTGLPHISLIDSVSIIKLVKNVAEMLTSNENNIEDLQCIYEFLKDSFVVEERTNHLLIDLLFISTCDGSAKWTSCILDKENIQIDLQDIYKNTLLHWAAALGSHFVCSLLLENGATLNMINSDGHTPLDVAILEDQQVTLNTLLKYQTNINNNDELGLIQMLNIAELSNMTDLFGFFQTMSGFNLRAFTSALFHADESKAGTFIDLLYATQYEGVIDFKFLITKHLDNETFKKVVIGFILDSACIIGRNDVIEIIAHLSDCREYPTLNNLRDYVDIVIDETVYKLFSNLSHFNIACLVGNQDALNFLIQDNINSTKNSNSGGINVLHLACLNGDKNSVQCLLDHIPDLQKTTIKGINLLHLTVLNNNVDLFNYLCNQNEVQSTTKHFQTSALHLAAQRGYVDMVKAISSLGDIQAYIDRNGNTPLHYAASANKEKVVDILLKEGSDPALINERRITSIHCAIISGNINILKKILEHLSRRGNTLDVINVKMDSDMFNFLPHHRNKQELKQDYTDITGINLGATPLHLASAFGYSDMLEILIQNEADVNSKSENGDTPLHVAAQQGHIQVFSKLLKNPSVQFVVNKAGINPLHKAIRYHHYHIVKLILEHYAEKLQIYSIVNSTQMNYTPLQLASSVCNYEIVSILLEYGAEVNQKNSDGCSALYFACSGGNENHKIVQLLLDKGANINALTNNFETPLINLLRSCTVKSFYEYKQSLFKIMEILIRNGAFTDLLVRDRTIINRVTASLQVRGVLVLETLLSFYEKYSPLKSHIKGSKSLKSSFKVQSFTLEDQGIFEQSYWNICRKYLSNRYILRRHSLQDNLLYFAKQNLFNANNLVDSKNWKGDTELHTAIHLQDLDTAKSLLSFGGNINSQNLKGQTPLHIAVKEKNIDSALFLLNNGADKEIADYRGLTPAAYSILHNVANITRLLRGHTLNPLAKLSD